MPKLTTIPMRATQADSTTEAAPTLRYVAIYKEKLVRTVYLKADFGNRMDWLNNGSGWAW